MSIYDDLKPIAASLMAEFKQGTVNYIKLTPGAGPVDEPGAATEVSTPLNATVRGVSFKYVQQGLAVATDLMVTAGIVDGLTLDMRDYIEIDGVRTKIVQILPAPAAGTKVVWKFIVRA